MKKVKPLNRMTTSKKVFKKNKTRIYEIVIQQSIVYTWMLSGVNMQSLERWKRKRLRKMCGGTKDGDNVWNKKTNREVTNVEHKHVRKMLIWEGAK